MSMRIVFILITVFFISPVCAQSFSEYKKQVFIEADHRLPYRVLYPLDFDASKKYPLLIFLHGAFEKGDDNEAQLNIGGHYFLTDSNRKNFAAIVVFPQCPLDDSWVYFDTELDSSTGLAKRWDFPFYKKPTQIARLLKQLLDSMAALPFVDENRIYLGGLSQGAMGVFDLIARYPNLFAAAFPICGAGRISTASKFAQQTAVWIFHGQDDDIVPPYFSQQFYRKLKKLGGDVRYTEYPGVKHNSWTNAFKEPELLPWLFSKSKR